MTPRHAARKNRPVRSVSASPLASHMPRRVPPWVLRLAKWGGRIAFALGLAYAVLLGVQEGYDYATTSPRFEVRGLTYAPTPHVSDLELRRRMALEPGTNILSLDLEEVARRIAMHPWVARANVTRVLPDTLDVEVIEHEAAAVLYAGDFFLVDAEGLPFKRLQPGERGELPVITGLKGMELLEDPTRSELQIDQALAVLESYRSKRRPRLSEVHIDDTGAVTLYTAELGSQLRLGREDFSTALARYDALRAALGDESDKLAVAHLEGSTSPDGDERIVASFFATQETPTLVAAALERAEAQAEALVEAHDDEKPDRRRGRSSRPRIPNYE